MKPFENIVGKGTNDGNLFPQCFLSFKNKFQFLNHILFCCLQILSIRTSLKLCRLVKELTLYHKIPSFIDILSILWEKEKVLVTSNFSFPSIFAVFQKDNFLVRVSATCKQRFPPFPQRFLSSSKEESCHLSKSFEFSLV